MFMFSWNPVSSSTCNGFGSLSGCLFHLSTSSVILAGLPLNLPVKKDRIEYTNERLLLENDNGGEMDKLLFSSRLTSFLPGMPSQSSAFSSPAPGFSKCTYINHPVQSLYKAALLSEASTLVLQVKDSTLFKGE